MATEFVARNGLIVISGEIRGRLASGVVLSGSIASGQIGYLHLSSGAAIANLQSGSIVSGFLANNSVVSGSTTSGQIGRMHLSSGAVNSGQIGAGAVLSGSIISGQVSNSHLASGTAIGNLQSGSIGSGRLANASVVSGSIASGQIGRMHLSSGAINSGQIGFGAVVSGSIASGQISNSHLASGAAIGNLQSGSIGSGRLANASVVSGSIASGQIGQMHLSSGAVNSGQIGNGAVVSGSIASGQVSNYHLASGAAIANLQSGGIGSNLLANNSVVSGSIASGQISRMHLSSGAVSSGKISTNAVVSGSIASGQVGLYHVSSGSVFSGHLASGSVYGTVIGSGSISSGNIQVGQIGLNHFGQEISNNEAKKNNLRISVVSGVAVTSGDLTSQSTLYLVPYNGDSISLYDGTNWGLFTISGTSVSASTASLASGSIYDVYCYSNAGVPALEFSTAWTGGITSRADAIQYINGIPLKSGTLTRRFVGTVWARNSGTIDDGRQYRGVWNWDNRVTRPMDFTEATAHTYNVSGSLNSRPWNGASGNALYWIQGIGGIAANASMFTNFRKSAGAATAYAVLNFRTNINATPWNLQQSTVKTVNEAKTTAGAIQSLLGLNWVYAEETVNASGTFAGASLRLYNNIEG
jgi:hypothetical protein